MGTTRAPVGAGQLTTRPLRFGAEELVYAYGFECGAELVELLSRRAEQYTALFVLVDKGASEHAEPVLRGLGATTRIVPIFIDTHEQGKSLGLVEDLLTTAVDSGVDRSSAVVAMGGGVLGNVAGMVAALLYRGLPLIHLPTTPVAAFDAVLSAKQAVNLRYGKNLCGTYLVPSMIGCDLAWLRSVPQDQMLCGVAEMAKNVLAVVPHEYDRFVEVMAAGPSSSAESLTALLEIGIDAKALFLELDPKEKNEALVFEYGHTVGHALEFASRGAMSHGEAVAWGMLAAADVARQVCGLPEADRQRHESLVSLLRLDRTTLRAIAPDTVFELLRTDNKRGYLPGRPDDIAMVLLKSLGEPAGDAAKPLVRVPLPVVVNAVETLFAT